MALIEAEGAQAASMTRLATELGCGLIALYSHVPSTQALLDGVADTVAADTVAAGLANTAELAAGWSARLRAQTLAARRAAAAHPRSVIAVAGREPATASARRPAERAQATLRGAGFGQPDAARIARVLAAYQVGWLVLEVGVAPGLRTDGPASTGGQDRATHDADFEFGLDLLLRGMAGC